MSRTDKRMPTPPILDSPDWLPSYNSKFCFSQTNKIIQFQLISFKVLWDFFFNSQRWLKWILNYSNHHNQFYCDTLKIHSIQFFSENHWFFIEEQKSYDHGIYTGYLIAISKKFKRNYLKLPSWPFEIQSSWAALLVIHEFKKHHRYFSCNWKTCINKI